MIGLIFLLVFILFLIVPILSHSDHSKSDDYYNSEYYKKTNISYGNLKNDKGRYGKYQLYNYLR